MEQLTITQLKQRASDTAVTAHIDTQMQACLSKMTKTGKPYLELTLADSTDQFSIKIWDNLPQYTFAKDLKVGAFLRVAGDWTQNQYGLEPLRWDMRPLNQGEVADFLIGDPATRMVQDKDWADILKFTGDIADPRLHTLCHRFISEHGDHFRRTAAARKNHHARRGGLVEHVAQMMRSAVAITTVYTDLNLDLILAGILFHDCGKMWENSYPEDGFVQPFNIMGEMLGHIPLGINLASDMWQAMLDDPATPDWSGLYPLTNDVRLHLLHLIASHHGTYEFGSPTLPRTPEAVALHHIDNLDAKYEMFKQAYSVAPELAPDIYERQFPLPANLVAPLIHFPRPESAEPVETTSADIPQDTSPITKLEDEELDILLTEDEEHPRQPFNGELLF